MNWVWVQEFKMGPQETKSQSEVKPPVWKPPGKADAVWQGWDRLREWGQFLYEGIEGKTTEPDLGTMAYPHPGNCAAHGYYGYRCHESWLWNATKASGSLIQPTLPHPRASLCHFVQESDIFNKVHVFIPLCPGHRSSKTFLRI